MIALVLRHWSCNDDAMTDRLPDNLALLHSAFSKDAIDGILPGDSFYLEDVEFICKYLPASTPEQFYIVKSLPLVERYRELCLGAWKNGTIFELGIAEGGSTAFLALLAEPTKLIAIDLEVQELSALSTFLDNRRLRETVRPYYGVDQTDRARLDEILEAEIGDGFLDVVIDDCSHQLAATRASFEALFPRLRPGGMYVIEDWNADILMQDAVAATLADPGAPGHAEAVDGFREALGKPNAEEVHSPLVQLALELVLTRASLGDAIQDVTVDEYWIAVRRGAGPLDPATFRLDDLYKDRYGYLKHS